MNTSQLDTGLETGTITWVRHVTGVDETKHDKDYFVGRDLDPGGEDMQDGGLYIMCVSLTESISVYRFFSVVENRVTLHDWTEDVDFGTEESCGSQWIENLSGTVRFILAMSTDIEIVHEESRQDIIHKPARLSLRKQYPGVLIINVLRVRDRVLGGVGVSHFVGEQLNSDSDQYDEHCFYLACLAYAGRWDRPVYKYVLLTVCEDQFLELHTIAERPEGMFTPDWQNDMVEAMTRYAEQRVNSLLGT